MYVGQLAGRPDEPGVPRSGERIRLRGHYLQFQVRVGGDTGDADDRAVGFDRFDYGLPGGPSRKVIPIVANAAQEVP
jgi:hypothetical protein